MKEQLYKYWTESLEKFEEIWIRLTESQRHYHTPQHILELLTHIDNIDFTYLPLNSKEILCLASFYHDIVYDPKSSYNELLSSKLWEQDSLEFGHKVREDVSKIILATKDHLNTPKGDILLDLFLDIDLSILAAEEKRFNEYCDQIKQEYYFYPRDLLESGRKKILHSFLKEPFLFRTKQFSSLEAAAKLNLKKVLRNG
jgi:predicted metal-dependent HD superfamily phosphohydrolase